MTKSIKVSLSRAHKLVERVTREINEITSTVARLASPVTISVPSEASQVEGIRAKIQSNITARNELYSVLDVIRELVAAKNSKVGIPELLAKKAILQQRKSGLTEILSSSQLSGRGSVLANDKSVLNEYFDRMKEAEVLNPVRVAVMTEELVEQFQKELKEVQAQADTVSDDINDLNAKNSITFQISDEVASRLGL